MNENLHFSVELESRDGYEFVTRFDQPEGAELVLDEPPPLGGGRGPNAARLIAAAVANCLSASLLFCLHGKFRQDPGTIRAMATGTLARGDRGRYRIAAIDVVISLGAQKASIAHLDRCLEQFEDFCIVTESVRHGIPVSVKVLDEAGVALA